ncbi:MAG: gliding motility protein GldN [Bacteroidetes bacterium]|nr:gliding motility protein GldN [Bacteroidota bacterium]
MKKGLFLMALLLTVSVAGWAQQPGVFQPGAYRDGIYEKENSVNRRFIPYTSLRESDVQWTKRIWREIDMREKINQPLYYPLDFSSGKSRMSFLQVLSKHILTGEIIAFSDEQFLTPLTLNDLKVKIRKQGDSVEQSQFDEQGNEHFVKVLPAADSIWMYRSFRTLKVKEDWFFDRQKSVLEVRILGLGITTWDEDKNLPIDQYWVYFPECRPYFAKYEVFNVKNDAERRTYDDIFWKRMFNSTITKESNVYDRGIIEYAHGIDALLESERIKNDIFLYEHDMWHF